MKLKMPLRNILGGFLIIGMFTNAIAEDVTQQVIDGMPLQLGN